MFRVSVIIPVYNAEKYVEQAVNSALALQDTGEVVLIEDGSPDNALQKCLELEKIDSRVRLLRHPGGENRGAGASRNLGIHHAVCDYISFLDADDYYLANRFDAARTIFSDFSDADFVYEASQYESDYKNKNKVLRTLSGGHKGREIFYQLLEGRSGDFDTNTVTVRKEKLLELELFKTQLRLHQDTELWYRMAWHLKGYPGFTDLPVAIARQHGQNRVTTTNYQSRLLMWEELKKEFDPLPLSGKERLLLNLHYGYYKKGISGNKFFNKLRAIRIVLTTKILYLYHKTIK